MKEAFQTRAFQRKTLDMIAKVNAVLEAAAADGYTFTLRQMHYQFVHNKWYENTKQNYDRLGYIVDEGRKAGLIDWDGVEDRVRNLMSIPNYEDPTDFMRSVVDNYAENLWQDQDYYAEVWVEKDALIGVVERPANKYRVPYMACRGYMSTSEQYRAGKRFAEQRRNGKKCVLFYLGDHDPSGVDMTRNNDELVNWFARSGAVEVHRLGLNMDQIEELDLAPDYAKEKDSRLAGYIRDYETDESWELDALTPRYIDALIDAAIVGILDMDKFNAAADAEAANRAILQGVRDNWSKVARYMKYRNTETQMGIMPSQFAGALYSPLTLTANEVLDKAEDHDTDNTD